jgi:methylated-DNA-[protein]-cysteine S-methyltransferase
MKGLFCYESTPTLYGDIGIVWTQAMEKTTIIRIVLPREERSTVEMILQSFPDASRGSNDAIRKNTEQIQAYSGGSDGQFSFEYLDMDCCYDFQKKVLIEAKKIPRGRIKSYSRVAELIGSPKAARAVGTALARNPFPIIIPCHRVVRSNGELGGFGGGLTMKSTLLKMEGVYLDQSGRVDPAFML